MSTNKDADLKAFRESALSYHRNTRRGSPGKVALKTTTPLETQHDLAMAYSPGVAVPCEEIAADPLTAYDYTAKGNLVAVISNGTAVLGLGNIGALASKPVMEGKSVLFKKFANIDSVDVEIDIQTNTQEGIDKLIDTIASLEPTYGGINLEDIKAPECFEIERRLKERMNIPVFHDDQHGTAIIVTAAFINWIEYSGRNIEEIKLVASGAGASAISCLNLLVRAGLKKENILVCDRKGVIYEGRDEKMDPQKASFANVTEHRTIADALAGADVFLGLSGPGIVTKEMIASMGEAPLVMTLANPTPEIMPEETYEAKPDAIVCTGRSDYPNQVNNVLCFPFLFRGALDVGASAINEDMKMACVKAIAALARKEVSAEVANVYKDESLTFGADYLIPKPFDPRLIEELPIAVAKAAMDSGVAKRPIEDFSGYRKRLRQFFVRSQRVMGSMMEQAKDKPMRVVYSEGEDDRVLQAVQAVVDEGIARPILVGREKVVQMRIEKLGLRLKLNTDFQLVDPEHDPRYREYWEEYHRIMARRGVTPVVAKKIVRTNTAVIGALLVHMNEADALLCGMEGEYSKNTKRVIEIIGLKPGVETPAALSALIVPKGTYFFCDTQINTDPSAAQVTEMTLMAAEEVRRFGMEPKVALLSHSNFGSAESVTANRMRQAYQEIKLRDPELEIDGEMQADLALSEELRKEIMPDTTLKGMANLFVMPNVLSANIAFNLVKAMTDGITVGPLLLGAARPVHVLSNTVTPRGIINATAIATVGAQLYESTTVDGKTQRVAKK